MTIESPTIFIMLLIIPCLLITAMLYYLGKQYMQKEYRIAYMNNQTQRGQENKQFKLNAYERLAVLLERMMFPSLLYRTRIGGMDAAELEAAMLVTIQKEFEHNQSQQIYVSENLWKIIRLAKDDLSSLIMESRRQSGNDVEAYTNILLQNYAQWNPNAISVALSANSKEAKTIIG